MELSGLVAILDENGAFVEVRDLGPNQVAVKPGRAIPLVDEKPGLPDGHVYGEPAVQIDKGTATRAWPVMLAADDRSVASRRRQKDKVLALAESKDFAGAIASLIDLID